MTDGYCTCYGTGSDRMRDCGIRSHRIEANEVRGLGSTDPLPGFPIVDMAEVVRRIDANQRNR
jgi:hypothetical protein